MTILVGIIAAVIFFIVVSKWIRKPLENISPDVKDDLTPPRPEELQLTETGIIRKYPQLEMEGENLMVFYNGLLMSSGIGTLLAECNTVNDDNYIALIESCNEYFLFEFDSDKKKDCLTICKNKKDAEELFHSSVERLKN